MSALVCHPAICCYKWGATNRFSLCSLRYDQKQFQVKQARQPLSKRLCKTISLGMGQHICPYSIILQVAGLPMQKAEEQHAESTPFSAGARPGLAERHPPACSPGPSAQAAGASAACQWHGCGLAWCALPMLPWMRPAHTRSWQSH